MHAVYKKKAVKQTNAPLLHDEIATAGEAIAQINTAIRIVTSSVLSDMLLMDISECVRRRKKKQEEKNFCAQHPLSSISHTASCCTRPFRSRSSSFFSSFASSSSFLYSQPLA
jgi:hypothetical protein